ncbi:MAG: type II toxin-antitoxin system VapC family toxin [Chitinispirillaceae bacterium]|nr:type II toxin-antitoxin system VapC family toxin [Chitinispirillaceae bacterium]
MAYLDTSIVLPYYSPEKLSGRVENIILNDADPAISTLTAVEVASALSRKIREKSISSENAEMIWEQFTFHRKNDYYRILPVGIHHYSLAAEYILQFKTSLRTLDALHLAVASDSSLPVVTCDKQLHQAAKKLHLPCTLVK